MRKSIWAVVAVVLAGACGAGNPHNVGLYTPTPRDEVYQAMERKVVELGYTVTRTEATEGLIVAERTVEGAPSPDRVDKDELQIRVAPDATGVTKIDVMAALILAGTPARPMKRVSARSKTASDALALIDMYMKVR